MRIILDGEDLLQEVQDKIVHTSLTEILDARTFVDMCFFHYPGTLNDFWEDVKEIHPEFYRKLPYNEYGEIEELLAFVTGRVERLVVEALNVAHSENHYSLTYASGCIDRNRIVIELSSR